MPKMQGLAMAAVSEKPTRTDRLVGNRLVLIGTGMYLLEWVAIIGAQVDAPFALDTRPTRC